MPELPEVETVARQLASLLKGARLRSARVIDRRRIQLDRPGRLRGRLVSGVRRIGKWVVITCDRRGAKRPAALYLVVHLRMTGRLIVVDAPPRPAPKHLRACFSFDGGALLFVDPRRFGVLDLLDDLSRIEPAGVDPTADAFTKARLAALLGQSGQPLKPWLLRQDRLVGLGNIYASEILHRAGLDPRRPAGALAPAEIGRLHRATRQILAQAIKHCGTTFSDFQGARGEIGSYQRYLAVYGREGQPCKRCGETVQRILQQQRSTFFCGRCQPPGDGPQSSSPRCSMEIPDGLIEEDPRSAQ